MKLFEDPKIDRRFNRMQWRMLFATMIGYTLFYFMRKNFSFAMPGLQQDCGISKSMLGNFLFWGGIVYGLSKFLNGVIGDRMNPKRMFCFGLLVCTLVNVAFGFAPQLAAVFTGGGDLSMTALAWTFGILLVVLFALNRLFAIANAHIRNVASAESNISFNCGNDGNPYVSQSSSIWNCRPK